MTASPKSPLRSQGPGGTVRDSLASGIRTIDRQRGLGHEGSPESPRRKRGIAASSAVGFRARARPPGTEFLDAETGRQKSPPKWVSAHRDKITGNKGSEIPAETRYLASGRKRSVCEDWMVVCAVICEPVSSGHSPENWEFFAKFSK